MIQDIEPSVFNNTYTPDFPAAEDILFYFEGSRGSRRVAVRRGDTGISCPLVLPHTPDGTELRYLFSIDSTKYFLALSLQGGCPSGFSMERTSIFRICAPRDLCFAGMTACHLYEWYSGNRFCGRCGTVLKHSQKERALCCPSCGNVLYPVIAPAVIIGVTRGDSILMTRYANREYKGRALLAGFCEIGETVEQTVMREAMEEVGLHIKNIRYFGSQPWGFDGGLLMGFFAEAVGRGEIVLDTSELERASWVHRSEIEPEINALSLTAAMIDTFRKGIMR